MLERDYKKFLGLFLLLFFYDVIGCVVWGEENVSIGGGEKEEKESIKMSLSLISLSNKIN